MLVAVLLALWAVRILQAHEQVGSIPVTICSFFKETRQLPLKKKLLLKISFTYRVTTKDSTL